jgi:hypothetical protein
MGPFFVVVRSADPLPGHSLPPPSTGFAAGAGFGRYEHRHGDNGADARRDYLRAQGIDAVVTVEAP